MRALALLYMDEIIGDVPREKTGALRGTFVTGL
jgi:hypothetical protein